MRHEVPDDERLYFTSDLELSRDTLRAWTARLTGSLARDVTIEVGDPVERQSPVGAVVLYRRYDGAFAHVYEVIPTVERNRLPGVPQRIEALRQLADRTGCWILADPDDHQIGRVLLIAEGQVWYSWFDPELDLEGMPCGPEDARAAAWASRLNRHRGRLHLPPGLALEKVQSVIADGLAEAPAALRWERLEWDVPAGAGYDRAWVQAHLRHAYEVSYADLRPWRFVEEELAAWIRAVQVTSHTLGAPLYSTHCTFDVVRQIPGGSDHEAYALRVDGHTVEKVVYKVRLASW